MAKEFWDSEVHRRAIFYFTKVKTRGQSSDDGTTVGKAVHEWSSDGGPPLKKLRGPRGPVPSGGKSKGSGRNQPIVEASEVC